MPGLPAEARMGILIGIALVVLAGFAIFVLQQEAAEQKRAARMKPSRAFVRASRA
jgi:hypothetical protein